MGRNAKFDEGRNFNSSKAGNGEVEGKVTIVIQKFNIIKEKPGVHSERTEKVPGE